MAKAVKDAHPNEQFIKYNGIVVGPDSTAENASQIYPPKFVMRSEFVYDDSGRFVMYTRYTLDVTFILHSSKFGGDTTLERQNKRMQDVRAALSKPGGTLEIKGMGIGDVLVRGRLTQVGMELSGSTKVVGDPITVFDVFPQLIAFRPLGNNIAHEVIWSCSFNVCEKVRSESSSSGVQEQLRRPGPLALNYTQSWSVDVHGWMTRTISGKARVSGGDSEKAAGTLDDFRSKFRVLVPHMFKRTNAEYSYSQDGFEMDFSFVDEQIRSRLPMPPDVSVWDVTDTVEMQPMQSNIYLLTIRGRVGSPAHISPASAAQKFLIYIFSRVGSILNAPVQKKEENQDTRQVLPLGIDISRKYESHITDMTFRFRVIDYLTNPFVGFQMFDPSPDLIPTYSAWAESMKPVWEPYGPHSFRPRVTADDKVVSCSTTTNLAIGTTEDDYKRPGGAKTLPFGCQISEKNSWMQLRTRLTGLRQNDAVRHNLSVPGVPPQEEPIEFSDTRVSVVGGPIRQGQTDSAGRPVNAPGTNQVIEQQGAPIYLLQYEGVGIRVGFEPVVPTISSVNGVRVEPAEDAKEKKEVIGEIFGCQVWRIHWSRIYYVHGELYLPSKANIHANMKDDKGDVVNREVIDKISGGGVK